MSKRLRERDLKEFDDCRNCGASMTIHVVPMGDPVYLLRTGWCEACQRSRFSLDGCGNDVRQAADQLVQTLRRQFGAL